MAIKYYVDEDNRRVIGVLNGTDYDAINKINKMIGDLPFCACPEKYMMPHGFKAIVKCDQHDEFDAEKGKEIAKQRILDRYYQSFDKKIAKFREDLLMLNGKCFESVDIQ